MYLAERCSSPCLVETAENNADSLFDKFTECVAEFRNIGEGPLRDELVWLGGTLGHQVIVSLKNPQLTKMQFYAIYGAKEIVFGSKNVKIKFPPPTHEGISWIILIQRGDVGPVELAQQFEPRVVELVFAGHDAVQIGELHVVIHGMSVGVGKLHHKNGFKYTFTMPFLLKKNLKFETIWHFWGN